MEEASRPTYSHNPGDAVGNHEAVAPEDTRDPRVAEGAGDTSSRVFLIKRYHVGAMVVRRGRRCAALRCAYQRFMPWLLLRFGPAGMGYTCRPTGRRSKGTSMQDSLSSVAGSLDMHHGRQDNAGLYCSRLGRARATWAGQMECFNCRPLRPLLRMGTNNWPCTTQQWPSRSCPTGASRRPRRTTYSILNRGRPCRRWSATLAT